MERSRKNQKLATIGQYAMTAAIVAGIGVEIATGAEIGYLIITIGTAAFAVFTKLKK